MARSHQHLKKLVSQGPKKVVRRDWSLFRSTNKNAAKSKEVHHVPLTVRKSKSPNMADQDKEQRQYILSPMERANMDEDECRIVTNQIQHAKTR